MKRYFLVLAACALLSALTAGPALAGGGLLPIPQVAGPSPSNSTDQSNSAEAVNVPVLSGNNVALVNGGDQSSSVGTTQSQANVNTTDQSVGGTENGAPPKDGPVSPCGCGSEPSQGHPDDRSTTNQTDQSNSAEAVNVPVLSGNNVALVNDGSQSSSAGTTQEQGNANSTTQDGGGSSSNDTQQSNTADAVNVPVASGNNVVVLGGSHHCGCFGRKTGDDQTSSAGTTQKQANVATTSQPSSHGSKHPGSDNATQQSNDAEAINVPVASGNNVALVNDGNQTASAGTTQKQLNVSTTKQGASSPKPTHSGDTGRTGADTCANSGPGHCSKPEPKPCPKPEPKPCPKPEPKPCPKPEPCSSGSWQSRGCEPQRCDSHGRGRHECDGHRNN